MGFDPSALSPIYMGGKGGQKVWSYITTDSTATIEGAGYFNVADIPIQAGDFFIIAHVDDVSNPSSATSVSISCVTGVANNIASITVQSGGDLLASNNLSEVTDPSEALANLGFNDTGDARYTRKIDDLTTTTSLEDTDLLPLYDNSAGDNASISWGGMKSALSSLTLDHFAEGGDGDNIWHTSGRDLVCQGKRAMVGFSTGDDDILAVNYAADFEWLDLFGKHRNNIDIVRDWPGIQLHPTVNGGYGYIDLIKHDRPGQDYQFRFRSDANSEQVVFEHYDSNDVYSHIHSLTGDGNIWTKSYGWLHDKFADQNGPQLAKAWASIDGTGTVVANGSYGFSQIQDMGTGKYRCTFSTARPNANYCAQVSSTDRNGHGKGGPYIRAQTTTYVEVGINRTGIGHMDEDIINVVVFGD